MNNNPVEKRSVGRTIADVILYLAVFAAAQFVFVSLTSLVTGLVGGSSLLASQSQGASSGNELIVGLVLASAFTLCLFVKLKWSPVSATWLRSHPWDVLIWAGLLSFGSILPSEWMLEKIQIEMPESQLKFFEQIIGQPMGYLAIGVFAPLVEELVFRGAILRKLLGLFDRRYHWAAIAISSVLFGLLHGNVPQFIHAFVIGLLLGWMYYRTSSVLPGVLFHWVNNTVAFIMFNAMPQMGDGKLIDLFHGNSHMMWMGLLFSLCILLPSLFQLALRMKPADK